MEGGKNILIGGGIMFAGIVITTMSFSASGDGSGSLFWGAILFGGIQLLIGLFQFLSYSLKSEKGKSKVRAKAGMRGTLRAMLAISAADGELEIEEITMIQVVSNSLLGEPLSQEQIIQVFAEVKVDSSYNIRDEFKDNRHLIDDDFAELIIKSMLLVAYSDKDYDSREKKMVDDLSSFFGLSATKKKELEKEAIGLVEEIGPLS